MVVRRAVPGDPEEPSAEGQIVPKRRELPERLQEYLLHEVVHVLPRDGGEQYAVNRAGPTAVELRKGAAVPHARGPYEGGFHPSLVRSWLDHGPSLSDCAGWVKNAL